MVTRNKVSAYSKNGFERNLTELNQGRALHACSSYLSGGLRVEPKIWTWYLFSFNIYAYLRFFWWPEVLQYISAILVYKYAAPRFTTTKTGHGALWENCHGYYGQWVQQLWTTKCYFLVSLQNKTRLLVDRDKKRQLYLFMYSSESSLTQLLIEFS